MTTINTDLTGLQFDNAREFLLSLGRPSVNFNGVSSAPRDLLVPGRFAHNASAIYLVLEGGNLVAYRGQGGHIYADADPAVAGQMDEFLSRIVLAATDESRDDMDIARDQLHERFLRKYEKAVPLPYKSEWANSTGYLNHLVGDATLPKVTAMAHRSEDDAGRRMLIAYDMLTDTHVVIFERYAGEEGPLVFNCMLGLAVSEEPLRNDQLARSLRRRREEGCIHGTSGRLGSSKRVYFQYLGF